MLASRVAPADDAKLSEEQRAIAESEDGAEEYLLTSWFYRAMESIRETRLANGLTQEAVAQAIGTTQSAVARLENAHRGNFSLDRFLRYAWASGAAPLDFAHVPPPVLQEIAMRDPAAERTFLHVRLVGLADALSLGRLTVNAALTWESATSKPERYSLSYESCPPGAFGNATNPADAKLRAPEALAGTTETSQVSPAAQTARDQQDEDRRRDDARHGEMRTAA